jgi:hypothetical protein
MSKMALKD